MGIRMGLLLLGCLIPACAGIKVERLKNEASYSDGVRFYRPAQYLLVSVDDEGKKATSVIQLPNTSQEYVCLLYTSPSPRDS